MVDSVIGLTYTPAVDICTMIICLLLCCMLLCSYTPKSKNLIVFVHSIICLFLACGCRIAANVFIIRLSHENLWTVYLFRDLAYALLMVELVFVCIYLRNLIPVSRLRKKRFTIFIWLVAIMTVILDCTSPLTKTGFYIDHSLTAYQSSFLNYYRIGFVIFLITLIIVLIIHRKRFIQKMYYSFWIIMFFVISVYTMQWLTESSSYTCMTYLFPLLAVMFIFHFNSYDTKTGMLEARTFSHYVEELGNRQYTLIFIFLEDYGQHILDGMAEINANFDKAYFADSVVFRLRDDKICIAFEDAKNPNQEEKIQQMMRDLERGNEFNRIDYKMVIMPCQPDILDGREYFKFNIFLEKKMSLNSVYFVQEGDVDRFKKNQYILSELKDIYTKKNLDDPRVLVYAQPVYNVEAKCFNSAEALMRLELPAIGIVKPEEFISLAEKNQYIHVLSLIILNKTCKQMKNFLDEGYKVKRISVNIAIEEFVLASFFDDITTIINSNGLKYENIALEITESQKENEFSKIKDVITRLHNIGIKFYLDDFGTSYSNLERILGLPVDIVKFDKSMLKLATKDENSKTFARTMSQMFQKLYFKVLFEGVETDEDEQECIDMYSQYLQGYKYSMPIPIEKLTEFFDRDI